MPTKFSSQTVQRVRRTIYIIGHFKDSTEGPIMIPYISIRQMPIGSMFKAIALFYMGFFVLLLGEIWMMRNKFRHDH